MRFSRRSKLSIILSFVAILAIVAGFAVTGFMHGSTGKAHAASASGSNLPTTFSHLKYQGVASFKTLSTGAIPATTGPNETAPDTPEGPAKVAKGNPTALPTVPPNPPSNGVTSNNPNFAGFNALSHVDSRLASSGNQFSLEPPDQGLCAGNGMVLEAVNSVLAVYSAAPGHTLLKTPTALNAFLGLPPAITRTSTPVIFGPFVGDPKCYFDPQTQHWFLTNFDEDRDPLTGLAIRDFTALAVSQTTDPTGLWTVFLIDASDDGMNGTPAHPNCPCFGDQPLIGADNNGFYISTNEFALNGPGFNGAQVYALSKAGIIAAATGGPLPTVVHIDASGALVPFGGLSYSVQPATSPNLFYSGAHGGFEYFLSALDFLATLDNRVAVWAMTNTKSLSSATPSVTLSVVVINSETYGQPPNATQRSGPRPLGTSLGDPIEQLATNDDRMNQVVFAQGWLWSGVNTIVQNNKAAPRSGIAYFIVNPGWNGSSLVASMFSQGYVAQQGANVLFPSIGVTTTGKAVMSFTLSGPSYFPSTADASISATSGSSQIHIAGAGQLPEDGFTGYPQFGGTGVARWGDYSAAVASGNTVWLSAEYIPNLPRTTLANWGTFISSVRP